MTLDNTGPGNDDSNPRLNATVSLSNGTLEFLGSDQGSGGTSTQSIPTVTLNSGVSTITSSDTVGNTAELTLSALSRAVGTGGIALVNGVGLGNAGSGEVFVSAGITLVGSTAPLKSGINAGVYTRTVPYLLGESGTASGDWELQMARLTRF